jgi:nucleoside-diphosphate-sugar epimerase
MNISNNILSIKGPILVFGSSGFVGSNLIQEILKYRSDCYAITHNPRSAWRLKLMSIPEKNIIHCDITYKKSVQNVFNKIKPKTIFNLSAYGAYSKQQNINLIYETNLIGTINILDECKDIFAYIHAGSSSEYGDNSSSPHENDALLPNSHYSVSKISSSYLLNYYGKKLKLPCLNLRLYSIYGPWEEPDRLIPQVVENALKLKYPPLVNPQTSRDFVYIDDCICAFVNAALYVSQENSGESINIGTGTKTTLLELTKITKEIFNIESSPNWGTMQNRNWDTLDWYGNFNKAEKLIHWKPLVELKQGLKLTADWQKKIN